MPAPRPDKQLSARQERCYVRGLWSHHEEQWHVSASVQHKLGSVSVLLHYACPKSTHNRWSEVGLAAADCRQALAHQQQQLV